MRRPASRGASIVETILLIPVLVLLMVGGMEFGKIFLTYYTLHKALRGAAGMASVLRGADFCDTGDPQLTAIRNFVVFGPDGNGASPLVRDLDADRIVITPERFNTEDGTIGECGCGGGGGCGTGTGTRAPDYILVTIDGGYPYEPQVPFRVLETILLRPHVRVPFGGQ